MTFHTFWYNKKPSASPRAFYCTKMCEKSKSTTFSYYELQPSGKCPTYILCNLSVVISVHQLEGFLVFGFFSREFGPREHSISVLVVRLKHFVHILSDQSNQTLNHQINQSVMMITTMFITREFHFRTQYFFCTLCTPDWNIFFHRKEDNGG